MGLTRQDSLETRYAIPVVPLQQAVRDGKAGTASRFPLSTSDLERQENLEIVFCACKQSLKFGCHGIACSCDEARRLAAWYES